MHRATVSNTLPPPADDVEAWRRARALLASLTAPGRGVSPRPPSAPVEGGIAGGPEVQAGRSHGPLTRVPPEASPLDLTRLQLLSPQIEERRRELLASHRERWQNRASELGELLAWYQGERDARERGIAQLEAAGMHAAAIRAGWAAQLAELVADMEHCRRLYKYARARERSLTEDLGPRRALCGKAERWIRCTCEGGAPRPVPVGCRQRCICAPCRARWAGRMRRRLLEVAPTYLAAPGSRTRMITLTVQHSGDLARDRREIVKGWEALRKQLHKWWGYAVPFCMMWETKPGTDGLGHEHAHIVVLGGPAWWPYAAIQRVWKRACPRSSHLDIAIASRKQDQAKAAASYICKYATKGADLDGEGWSDELVAQVIAAHYNQRWVTTSHRFWLPEEPICKHCGEHCRIAKPPNGWRRTIDVSEGMVYGRIGGERAPPDG